jgi:hypothetical protein
MANNVTRLSELLEKDSLTGEERNEGVNLAQAMFGSQALATLDNILIKLRSKKVTDINDPAALLQVNTDAPQVVIGAGKDTSINTPEVDEAETELKAGEFALNGSIFGEKQDSKDRVYYVKDGKRISAADFEAARVEVAGSVDTGINPEVDEVELPTDFTKDDVVYSQVINNDGDIEYRAGDQVILEAEYRAAFDKIREA